MSGQQVKMDSECGITVQYTQIERVGMVVFCQVDVDSKHEVPWESFTTGYRMIYVLKRG